MNTESYILSLRSQLSNGFDIWSEISLSDFLNEENREVDIEIQSLLELHFENNFKFIDSPEGAQDGILRATVEISEKIIGLPEGNLKVYFSKFNRLVVTSKIIPEKPSHIINQSKFEAILENGNFNYLGVKQRVEALNLDNEDWFDFFFNCYG